MFPHVKYSQIAITTNMNVMWHTKKENEITKGLLSM